MSTTALFPSATTPNAESTPNHPTVTPGRRTTAANPVTPAGRDTAWMTLGFLAVLVLGDVLLDRARLPDVYGSVNAARAKWDRFTRAARNPDVVFLGSSLSLMGINPSDVQRALSQHETTEWPGIQTHASPRCYNLAATACPAYTQYLLVRRLIHRQPLPRVVYLELVPAGTVATPAPWIKNGIIALGGADDLWVGAAVGGETLKQSLLSAAFRSHRHWGDLRLAVRHLVLGAPIRPVNPKIVDQPLGWATPAPGVRSSALDRTDATQSKPARRLQTSLAARINHTAVIEAVQSLRAHGITVRLYEPPFSSAADPRDDPDYNDAYQQFVTRIHRLTGLIVLRPPESMFSDRDFFDTKHLNAQGARKLSRWIARDVALVLSQSEHWPESPAAPGLTTVEVDNQPVGPEIGSNRPHGPGDRSNTAQKPLRRSHGHR